MLGKYLPQRKIHDWKLPEVYPVSSVQETLLHFPTEGNLKNSSLKAKNSRWNNFVAYAASRRLLFSSFCPEDFLAYQSFLADNQSVKKPDDYVVTARQRLLVLRRIDVDAPSQVAYQEVIRGRVALGNKSYSPTQALPITTTQLKNFKSRYSSYGPIADFWLFTGFRMSSMSSESLSMSKLRHVPKMWIVSTESKSTFSADIADWRYVPAHIADPVQNMLPIPRWKLDQNVVRCLTGKSHSFRRTTALAIRIRAEKLGVSLPSIQGRINRSLGWRIQTDASFKHYTKGFMNFMGTSLPMAEELAEYVFRKSKAMSSNEQVTKQTRKR